MFVDFESLSMALNKLLEISFKNFLVLYKILVSSNLLQITHSLHMPKVHTLLHC